MTRITIDADLERKLLGFSRELELCDQEGRIVARVKPVIDAFAFDPQMPLLSTEELDRISKSPQKRYSTQEMLEYLEKL
jgi:hypothetical protein